MITIKLPGGIIGQYQLVDAPLPSTQANTFEFDPDLFTTLSPIPYLAKANYRIAKMQRAPLHGRGSEMVVLTLQRMEQSQKG